LERLDQSQVGALVRELGHMIEAARQEVAVTANAALTSLDWQLGHRVRTEVLDGRRAEYGGRIVAALRRQLGWGHFEPLIPRKDALRREFYAEMSRIEAWSTRELKPPLAGIGMDPAERRGIGRTGAGSRFAAP
jgi:hypothetical protein